jgi:hypothetical protein
MKQQITKQDAIQELWRRGSLSFLLDSNQKELHKLYQDTKNKINVWLLPRRFGKSYSLIVFSSEVCLRNKKAIISYLAPSKLMVNQIIRPLMKNIFESCPEELRPQYNTKDYTYYFPNGAELRLAGADSGHAEKLRGGDAHLIVIDEAGSISNLDYIVKSILLPTTLLTKGKIIIASTPSLEPDHEFHKFVEEAEMNGTLVRKTIYDNPRLSKEDIDELIKEVGGVQSLGFKRELLCEIVRDSNITVIPEYSSELESEIVKDWPKPPFYDTYVSMDLGFKDATGILFGYYDFRSGKVIIEDEILLKGEEIKLPELSERILKKEEELWTDLYSGETRRPYLRISDINYIVTSELNRISGGKLSFTIPRKDDKDAAINELRVMLANKKIIIHPRCVNLRRHLRNVKWKSSNNKTVFARSPDDSHYDLVDACQYLIRMISYNKNPYPSDYQLDLRNMHINNPKQFDSASSQMDVYKKIFNVKSKPYGR